MKLLTILADIVTKYGDTASDTEWIARIKAHTALWRKEAGDLFAKALDARLLDETQHGKGYSKVILYSLKKKNNTKTTINNAPLL